RYVQAVPGGAVNPETHLWLNVGEGRFMEVDVVGVIDVDRDLFDAVVMDYNHDGRDEILMPDPSEVIHDFCYLYFSTQAGGPPSEGPQEGIEYCATGVHRFEGSPIPHLNRAVYGLDQIRFVPQVGGGYRLERDETVLSGPIFATGVCDNNDDGLLDL